MRKKPKQKTKKNFHIYKMLNKFNMKNKFLVQHEAHCFQIYVLFLNQNTWSKCRRKHSFVKYFCRTKWGLHVEHEEQLFVSFLFLKTKNKVKVPTKTSIWEKIFTRRRKAVMLNMKASFNFREWCPKMLHNIKKWSQKQNPYIAKNYLHVQDEGRNDGGSFCD